MQVPFFFQQVWLYFKVGLADQPWRGLRLITLTETLIKRDITKSETNDCFIIHCFKDNIDKLNTPSQGRQSDIALGNHALRV